ncbi:DivIVA domain-containing protein [Ferrimicrobium acidiphilum]|uniref:DivIVA domain-containing protein n=1 Tax=Ferrimicrobium acidiphilum TaxID=121039 RepID=UPI0023F080F4|nr:DivIVA domain-containing protein [Ferrimicrobium acidiphilum]
MEENAVDAQKIREVEFRERMRGYHQEDVDEFLEQVAKGVEVLETQLTQAREELARLKANHTVAVSTKSNDFSDDVIQRTLIVAQKAADQLRSDAESEAREIRAEAQRQAERILGEARTTSRLIEEDRRKNLLQELAQLEGEFNRRQEQLANIVTRDRAVRQKITDEIGGLLSLVRAADAPTTEALLAQTSTALDSSVGVEEAVGDDREFTRGTEADSADASEGYALSGESDLRGESDPRGDGGVSGEPRPVQEFVFGHDISAESTDDEPFMLWRQDD